LRFAARARALAVPLGLGAGFVIGAAWAWRHAPAPAADRGERDPLTGLATAPVFEDRLRNALDRRLRAPAPLAVLLVDLDGFAALNAEHGHDAGDAVLRTVAERLRGCVRTADTVARVGGDAFAVLVDLPGEGSLEVLGRRVRRAVGSPVDVGGGRVVEVAGSVAVVVSDGGHDVGALLAEARERVVEIKRGGGGRLELVVVPFD
jgi:diguanylate cyclase (GGDEF)-like protein